MRLLRILLLLGTLGATLPVGAYPAGQPVHQSPNGRVIGAIRQRDEVEVLGQEAVRTRRGVEHWGYVEYGDAYSGARGWIDLDRYYREQRPAPRRDRTPQPYAPQQPGSGAEVDIRDIDIHCTDTAGGHIGSCDLTIHAQPARERMRYVQGQYSLICGAELHWTQVGGRQRVLSDRAEQAIRGEASQSMTLHYRFDPPGATGATVENQYCRLQAPGAYRYREPADSNYPW